LKKQESKIPLIIVGAGPAGLMAAIAHGEGALILERNPFAGKKLLLSGSGQCNFSNTLDNKDFLRHCGNAANFIKPALYSFDSKALVTLLEENGCQVYAREDGKLFPASMRSAEVRDLLLSLALQKGVRLEYNQRVQSIAHQEEAFLVVTEQGSYLAERVLLATGGKSYPDTGSDGCGYDLAKALGHSIIAPKPALAGVEIEAYESFHSCAGISCSPLAIRNSNGKRLPHLGDILFTHKGLSGPGIINNAHLLCKGDRIKIGLAIDSAAILLSSSQKSPTRELHTALKGFGLADALGIAILNYHGIDPATRLSELRKTERMVVAKALEELTFTIKCIDSWDKAMATSGGISLAEVNAKTMESRLMRGLYFAGEMLNYDVPSGGFNIQLAVSTGWLAGQVRSNWK
jgi:predicted Rossmann fold flavoprotein